MSAVSSKHLKVVTRVEADQAATCPNCRAATNQSLRHCPACAVDLGFPNVRSVTTPTEIGALSSRFDKARESACNRGLVAEFDALVSAVNSLSHVVVAMPPLVARDLLSDPRKLYAGYEGLVGGSIRIPAPFANDTERCSVAGQIFGSYAKDIRYGVLSLDGMGLRSYGLVFARLRDLAIEKRVSFLHENSYFFFESHKMSARDKFPTGYRSCWKNRAKLVASKIEPTLTAGSGSREWAGQLIVRGKTREEERCIEAHIYEGFNVEAIEAVEFADAGATRSEKNDIACIVELMAKRSSGRGAA